ncbi:amidohydrolase family-domain-containing protein [Hyaloraphidium curvatum]|nr:amidohydrolase family-domain-containing protein [Hyaloraphidium curvatum]
MAASPPHRHAHSGCICSWAAGLISDEATAKFAEQLALPTDNTLRLRGGIPPPPPDGNEVRTIVLGKVWTADAGRPWAEAVAISLAGKILGVGGKDEIVGKFGSGGFVEVVDLGDKYVGPGFFEPHMHPTMGGIIHETTVDLYPFTVSSAADAVARLAARAAEMDAQGLSDDAWCLGNGYDEALTPPYRPLTLADLDGIPTKRPIYVTSNTLHTGYCNSKCFEMAGITEESVKGDHEYRRGPDGKLTGVIVEDAVFNMRKILPLPSPELIISALQGFLTRAAKKGCTTVVDAAMGMKAGSLAGDVGAYLQLVNEARLPCRVGLSPWYTAVGDAVEVMRGGRQAAPGEPVFFGRDELGLVSLHAIKFILDGTNQTATAYQTKPYKVHPDSVGEPNFPDQAKLIELTKAVKEAGFSAMMHANGDAAIDQALDAFSTVFGPAQESEIYTGRGFRRRIEHCTICREDQVARMRALNVSPSFLMQHLLYWGSTYRDKIHGAERAERMDPAGDCIKHNVLWTMHCDNPVTPIQPLQYVETAVVRKNFYDGKVLGPEQCVPVEEAMKAVTINGAIQSGLQDITGSLLVGKSADLVVLAKSPFEVPPDEIKSIPILETWLGGGRMRWDE